MSSPASCCKCFWRMTSSSATLEQCLHSHELYQLSSWHVSHARHATLRWSPQHYVLVALCRWCFFWGCFCWCLWASFGHAVLTCVVEFRLLFSTLFVSVLWLLAVTDISNIFFTFHRELLYVGRRLVATGVNRFSMVFPNYIKPCDQQPKNLRVGATTTVGPVFFGCVRFSFGFFFGPCNWTCEH